MFGGGGTVELMEIRRGLLMAMGENGLKKKTFHVGRQSANQFYLQHNLGVLPKFIVLLDDNQYTAIDDYSLGEIFSFFASPVESPELYNTLNGACNARNLASGKISFVVISQSNVGSSVVYWVTTTELTIKKPLGNSDWSIAPSYTVDIYY